MIRAPADAKDRNVKFDLILRRADDGLNDDENQSDKIGNDFWQICVKPLKGLVHRRGTFLSPRRRKCPDSESTWWRWIEVRFAPRPPGKAHVASNLPLADAASADGAMRLRWGAAVDLTAGD
jgi:hypothetical protein